MRGEKKQQKSSFISKRAFQALCVDLWSSVWPWNTGEKFFFLEVMDWMNTVLKCIGFCLFERLSMIPLKKRSTQWSLSIKSRKHLKFIPQLKKLFPPNLQNFRTHYNSGARGRFFVRQGNCSFIGLLHLSRFQLLPWLLTQLMCTEHFQSWLKNCHLCTVCHNSGKSVPTNQCCH